MQSIEKYIDIEGLVAGELLNALDMNLIQHKDEGGYPVEVDTDLIRALVLVIQYYTSFHSFDIIMEDRKEKLKSLGIEIF